jgi:hypothetical protein
MASNFLLLFSDPDGDNTLQVSGSQVTENGVAAKLI